MSYQNGHSNPYNGTNAMESVADYEMGAYHQTQPHPPPSPQPAPLPLQQFLNQINALQHHTTNLSSTISLLATLHQRTLDSTEPDPQATTHLNHTIDGARSQVSSIRDALALLSDDIRRTKSQPGASKSLIDTKTKQFAAFRRKFEAEVQRFLQAESTYRQKYQAQIARQYRIVRPDASDAQVRQAMEEDWSAAGGVFQQTLASSRGASAQRALSSVRERHAELQTIELTMSELSAVMQEMARLVEEQDVHVVRIEEDTHRAVEDLRVANEEVSRSVKIARALRRHKWMCVGITLLIVIAIALGVGLGVYFGTKTTNTATGG